MSFNGSSATPRLAALRHRDFRLLWGGQMISVIGSQMQLIAINWHVFRLLEGSTASITLFGWEIPLGAEALGLGGVGLVRVIPIALFAMLGGALADVRNRREILIWSYGAAALFAALLAMLTLTGQASVLAVYLLTAATSATAALSQPAHQSLIPNLVPKEHLTNAISLNSLIFQVGTIVGPALAGVLMGLYDEGVIYLLNALSFGVIILALSLLRHRGGAAARDTGLGWPAIVEGWRFTRGSRIIWSTMMLDFLATFFSSARTMLPLVATQMLGVGVQGYGVLATAQAVGALLAGVVLSLRRDIYRQGMVLLVSVAIYGLATALFGLSTIFAASYFFFAITGAADTVSMVIRQTIRQIMTPDHLRGRMTGINMIFFMGGPQLGELEAGLVAAVIGVPLSILSGGLATVLLTGIVAWRYPRLRRYVNVAGEA